MRNKLERVLDDYAAADISKKNALAQTLEILDFEAIFEQWKRDEGWPASDNNGARKFLDYLKNRVTS